MQYVPKFNRSRTVHVDRGTEYSIIPVRTLYYVRSTVHGTLDLVLLPSTPYQGLDYATEYGVLSNSVPR